MHDLHALGRIRTHTHIRGLGSIATHTGPGGDTWPRVRETEHLQRAVARLQAWGLARMHAGGRRGQNDGRQEQKDSPDLD